MTTKNIGEMMTELEYEKKIRRLLQSSDEVNRQLACELMKGNGIPPELHQELQEKHTLLCLQNGFTAPFAETEKLNLSRLQLTDIPGAMGYLPRLKFLFLPFNDLEELPVEMGHLSTLKRVYLDGNRLTSFPRSFRHLENLERIALVSNKLEKIPAEVFYMRKMRWLDVSFNKIKKLPAEIGKLQHMEFLTLSHNQIQHIPESIGKLTKLTSLSLDHNPLSKNEMDKVRDLLPQAKIRF